MAGRSGARTVALLVDAWAVPRWPAGGRWSRGGAGDLRERRAGAVVWALAVVAGGRAVADWGRAADACAVARSATAQAVAGVCRVVGGWGAGQLG